MADLVAANALLACVRAGLDGPPGAVALIDRVAKAATSRPGSWIVNQRLQRELPMGLPAESESNGADSSRSITEGTTHIHPSV